MRELPAVPEEFLYVMGLSSAGYLGGKFARQPGPILTGASISPGSVILTLRGTNLSPSATVYLNDTQLLPSWIDKQQGEVLVPEDDGRYAKQLRFVLPNAKLRTSDQEVVELDAKSSVTGPFSVRLVNADGQSASYSVHVSATAEPLMTIAHKATLGMTPPQPQTT
jgi:hypothetical protein